MAAGISLQTFLILDGINTDANDTGTDFLKGKNVVAKLACLLGAARGVGFWVEVHNHPSAF